LHYKGKSYKQKERRQWLPDMQQGAATEFQREKGLTLLKGGATDYVLKIKQSSKVISNR
jgi:hypothetical protein